MSRQVPDIIREEIQRIFQTHAAPLIAVDGRCASGKTTLAAQMQKDLGCNVIHMDDFFLRSEQRTEERLRQPGGNIDWERFREEVLTPFRQGVPFSYRPYDCHMQDFREPISIIPNRLTVVEGSYSCHPELWDYYNLHIFLSVSPDEQMRRIQARNGPDQAKVFSKNGFRWKSGIFKHFKSRKDVSFVLMKKVGENARRSSKYPQMAYVLGKKIKARRLKYEKTVFAFLLHIPVAVNGFHGLQYTE